MPELEAAGLKLVGRDETGERMEILEINGHPFFLAVQFHPEFKSRPGKPSPVFLGEWAGAAVVQVIRSRKRAASCARSHLPFCP